MNQLVTIQNVGLPVVEYIGKRVVTFAMMDLVHGRVEGTAGRNFREHRDRLIDGEDFYELTADEIRRQSLTEAFPPRTPKGIIVTESGYLMLVKSFTDDLAWEVQRSLVNRYFTKDSKSVLLPSRRPVETTTEAAKLFKPLFQTLKMIGCNNQAAAISANQAVQKVAGINLLELMGQTHIEAENQDALYFTPTELGTRINVSARKLNQLLAEAGFQLKRGEVWEVMEAGKDFARIYDTGKRHGSGVPVQQIKWAATVLPLLKPSMEDA